MRPVVRRLLIPVATALMGSLLVASPAAAAGTLTGKVTSTSGTPLTQVQVYVMAPDAEGTTNVVTAVQTNGDGAYSVAVPAASYSILFDENNGDYVDQWHLPVAVGEGASTVVNAALAPASHVTGTVRGPSGAAIVDATVTALRLTPQGWVTAEDDYTDAAGNYDIGGLAAGTYRVKFQGKPYGAYFSEFHPDQPTVDTAHDVSTTVGTPVVLDASLVAAGQVSGRAVDAKGEPVVLLAVQVYRRASQEWTLVNTGRTDPFDGTYTVGELTTGTYRVCFDDSFLDRFLRACHAKAKNVGDATDVAVTVPQTTRLPDTQLALIDLTPPKATVVGVPPSGNPEVGTTIRVKVAAPKEDGVSQSFQWFANGTKIKKATTPKLKVTRKLKGKKLALRIQRKREGLKTVTKFVRIKGRVR